MFKRLFAKMSRVDVFKKLRDERDYQQSRWTPNIEEYGVMETRFKGDRIGAAVERYHEIGAWISFMETYLEEARDINSKTDDLNGALLKVRAVAALAVACLEQHSCPDRPGWVPPVVSATSFDKPNGPSFDKPDLKVGELPPNGPAYHGAQPHYQALPKDTEYPTGAEPGVSLLARQVDQIIEGFREVFGPGFSVFERDGKIEVHENTPTTVPFDIPPDCGSPGCPIHGKGGLLGK